MLKKLRLTIVLFVSVICRTPVVDSLDGDMLSNKGFVARGTLCNNVSRNHSIKHVTKLRIE
jgi:hypothetical protein